MRIRFGQRNEAEQRRLHEIEERAARMLGEGVLGAICPELWLEHSGNGALALRPREAALLPLVDHLVTQLGSKAPPIALAPVLPLEEALKRAREIADFSQARLRVGFARGHLLDVVFALPGGSGSEREIEAATRLVFDLLGPRLALAWLGRVSVVPAPRLGPLKVLDSGAPSGNLVVAELAPTFKAAIQGLYAGLPDSPYGESSHQEEWSLFELEPEPARDYAAQDDLVFASTCVPEALKCYLSGLSFASERFSRFGERFFYIKYRCRGAPEVRLEERQQLEDLLDRSLLVAKAGRVVGAGLGLAYSYVHCALSSLERGLALMAEAAQRRELPEQAWLLPFDAEFAEEWLGVWPGAEAPPVHRA
ncbi:MAG TPA: hypothetical protein VFQ61_32525 [Polyangiaceae bacterium]|nr:hypothetical protein [Polyangiaceae bacterium]